MLPGVYVEAVGLSKAFNGFYALRDLNLRVEGARCFGYLGPNGAGKTTTLKLFTNLLRPTLGEAYINGYSVHREHTKALKEVGVIVEAPEFYPYLTAREILSFQCDLRGAPRDEIPHVLEKVGLYEQRDVKVGKFSRGMKQRLALASALVTNPGILLLDEPTTGMDPMGMVDMHRLIAELKRESVLIFLSSHLLYEVTAICDEIAIIHRGQLLLRDSMENVERRFAGQVVLVDFADDVREEELADLPHIHAVEAVNPRRYRLTFRGGVDEQHALLRAMVERGLRVISYREEGLALERAYLKLIGGDEVG